MPAPASKEPMQGVVGSQAHGRRRSDHGVASLVSGDAGGASGTHRTIARVGVPKSQLCTAAAAAAVQTAVQLLEGVSEQHKVESPVDVPSSVMVHASAEMEEPICVGSAQALGLPAHLGTATEASITPMVDVSAAVDAGWLSAGEGTLSGSCAPPQ